MHESGDSHALRSSLYTSSFNLESLHELLDGSFEIRISIYALRRELVEPYPRSPYEGRVKHVFTLSGIHVFRELLKMRIRGITIQFFDVVGAASTSRTISARRRVQFVRTTSTVGIISRVFPVRTRLSRSCLIDCQYKIIGKILANRLSLVIDEIVIPEQSAFIKGRQILDGPLILNEVIEWCKARNEQALMFKVDFQKAFDSVRWDHVDDILNTFCFGRKWKGWIHGCLHSSKASILVNGSPTDEFSFHRGLRKGDHLSPFLFILVMESLHVAFQRIIKRGMFTPIFIGKDEVVSINVNKSSLFGLGIQFSDIHLMADHFGFLANKLPFTYRGVKVGASMTCHSSWLEVVQKVNTKLSKWKAKTLSVGGRLTLLKLVLGSLPTYYMSLFKVPGEVLNQLEGLCNSFFLGADLDERKMTWASERGVEECQWCEYTQMLSSVVMSSASDRWAWSLNGKGVFSMKSTREEIDKHLLVTFSSPTRWSKLLPIKVNVFSWHMFLDKLPTRVNQPMVEYSYS
nr:putative RNA-directed DNA polymerase, eukaryota, reverse transcriptase zinc-binding domain protein [Tanacetum cinerariifolium]